MEGLSGVAARGAFSIGVARKALEAASQIALKLLDGLPQVAAAGSGQGYGPSGGPASPPSTEAVKGRNLDTLV